MNKIEDLLKLRDQIPALESAGIHSTISLHDAITLCAEVNYEMVEKELNVDPYCQSKKKMTELLREKDDEIAELTVANARLHSPIEIQVCDDEIAELREYLGASDDEAARKEKELNLHREFLANVDEWHVDRYATNDELGDIIKKMKEKLNDN